MFATVVSKHENYYNEVDWSPDMQNRSVENAGVALVKGADERNKFFKKINKQ